MDKEKKETLFLRITGLFWVGLIVLSIWGFHRSSVAQLTAEGETISILLFGTDAADASKHTDTLMLAAVDPLKTLLRVLNIPRDTRVHIPGYRFRRVNEIFGYHKRKTDDSALAAKEVLAGVGHLLGGEEGKPLDIPFYAFVDYSGFRRIIDLMNGVWLTVKTPMHYDDFAGDYHFHKEPGRYLMKGEEALDFVRFRGATGDRGRILRQQEFLRAVAVRMANPVNLFRFPKIIGAGFSTLNTNLGFWDLVYLVHASRRIRASGLGFYILPGRPRGAYWEMRKEGGPELAKALLTGEAAELPGLTPIVSQRTRITVKVFNASGQRGLAYRLTRHLRSRGFDVVDWGNYPINQAASRVVDRSGAIIKAKKIAENLGIQSYHSEPARSALADVEVILGENYGGVGAIEPVEGN